MSRMTKEELREDPVLEWIQDAISFLQRNMRWILTGAIIVVAVIVGGVALSRSHQRAEREAAQQLAAAQRGYLQGAYAQAEVQLRQLIDAHGGTRVAGAARVYLGDALLAQQRATEALETYEEAIAKGGDQDPMVLAAAHRGRAAALESLSRPAEASQAYADAAQFDTAFTFDDLYHAGRTALEAGDAQRARALFERAQSRGDTRRAAEVDFYLAQAEAMLAQS
ncbi:MAG: tetratricopeptide repeat protein [Candidatus Eisenbacteria bacterium]|nr:tetratricopeptide repeat protein [Candidatus Eisenbacteria bacterium]